MPLGTSSRSACIYYSASTREKHEFQTGANKVCHPWSSPAYGGRAGDLVLCTRGDTCTDMAPARPQGGADALHMLYFMLLRGTLYVVQYTLRSVRRPRLLVGPCRTLCHHPPSPRSIPCVIVGFGCSVCEGRKVGADAPPLSFCRIN